MKIDVYRVISDVIEEQLEKMDFMQFSADDDEATEAMRVDRLNKTLMAAIQEYVDIQCTQTFGFVYTDGGLRVNVGKLFDEALHNGISYGVSRMFKHADTPDSLHRRQVMFQCITNSLCESPLFYSGEV